MGMKGGSGELAFQPEAEGSGQGSGEGSGSNPTGGWRLHSILVSECVQAATGLTLPGV